MFHSVIALGRSCLLWLAMLFAWLPLASAQEKVGSNDATKHPSPRRPNIVFLLADDK